jgi:outer membrane protein
MKRAGFVSALALILAAGGGTALAQEQNEQPQKYEEESVLKGEPGGLTADQVGKRAAETSYQAKAAAEAVRGASARVDEAWSAFFPHLATIASYTRLSDLTAPSLGSLVTTSAVCDQPQPCPVTSTTPLTYSHFSFPVILDNWLLQATLVVPISDYFLRIDQSYTAATQARDAARFDLGAARTKSASDGKIAFYNYLGAKGALLVAKLTLDDQKTHLTDTKNLAEVGNATRVDVLRGETAVSAAELLVVRAQNLVDLTLKQLRVALHVGDAYAITSGEGLDATALPPVQGNLPALIGEAQSQRFEVRSIDANAAAAREQAKVARNGALPVVSAFGDATLANPNQRIFPQSQTWFGTWDAGLRITWSPNDVPTSLAGAADASSRAAELDAEKQVIRDGIAVEVTQAYNSVQEADFSLQSTAKQLSSAREAVRVARELYKAGRVNSTTLTDAETDLTRARLAVLNARLDARTSRVRLEHALGRDNRFVSTSP